MKLYEPYLVKSRSENTTKFAMSTEILNVLFHNYYLRGGESLTS